MKTPLQLWTEYRIGIFGQEPMPHAQEASLRHAFVAGINAAMDVLEHPSDKETKEWFQHHLDSFSDGPPQENSVLDIDNMIQKFRTLRLSQLRKQLEHDDKHNIDRLIHVHHFLKLAKEKP